MSAVLPATATHGFHMILVVAPKSLFVLLCEQLFLTKTRNWMSELFCQSFSEIARITPQRFKTTPMSWATTLDWHMPAPTVAPSMGISAVPWATAVQCAVTMLHMPMSWDG